MGILIWDIRQMSRYKTKWNTEVYNQMIKEGYGKGSGAEYIPWIKVNDFVWRKNSPNKRQKN